MASGISFRKRLLLTLSLPLSLGLILTGVAAWFFVYSWLNYSAQELLDLEIREIVAHVVGPGKTVNLDAYYWGEPHHRYDARHIDPYFLQIFDPGGALQRASANISLFPAGTYPANLLTPAADAPPLIQRLRTFEVTDRVLYYRTQAFSNSLGEPAGYIQVARYDPGIALTMRWTTSLIIGFLIPLFFTILGVVWWSAHRVVAPLEKITNEAATLSSERLDQRITLPNAADTETQLLASTLNRSLEQLEQSFEEMKRFTANAAHELQTPLTILKGHIGVALRRERTPEAYRNTLTILLQQVEGLINIVHNLLQLARLDQDNRTSLKEPLDLVALLQGICPHFEQKAQKKGLAFHTQFPDAAWVQSNAASIREIVLNLLQNAINYTNAGEITVRLTVRLDAQKDAIVLEIIDTGVGMTPEIKRHASDRFFRAPNATVQNIHGSGLGLALVQQIAHQQNLDFAINSSPDVGTTARIVFNELAQHDSAQKIQV